MDSAWWAAPAETGKTVGHHGQLLQHLLWLQAEKISWCHHLDRSRHFLDSFFYGGCRLEPEGGACHTALIAFVASCSGTTDWASWPTRQGFTCLYLLTTAFTNSYTWLYVGLGIIYVLEFIITLLADLFPQSLRPFNKSLSLVLVSVYSSLVIGQMWIILQLGVSAQCSFSLQMLLNTDSLVLYVWHQEIIK